jgi:hypothetical protein
MPTTTINLTGQALSKTDDTNVTLTLGGTPSTALLKATSLTLGWSGTLADARITSAATWNAKESALTFSTGLTRTVNTITIDTAWVGQTSITTLGTIGTGTWNATPVSVAKGGTGITSYAIGDIIYASGTTTLSKLSAPAIGEVLLSGGIAAAPVYSGANLTFDKATSTFSIKTTAGDEWFFVEPTNNIIALGDIDSSGNGSTLVIDNTNEKITWNKSIFGIRGIDYTFPAANASGVLTNNGSGTLSWVSASSGIIIGGTTITSGADNRILFQDATASDFVTQTANFTMGSVATGYLDVPTGYALAGHKLIKEHNTNSLFAGNISGVAITTATQTTGFGYSVLNAQQGGSQNSAFGSNAMEVSNGGSGCSAFGYAALALSGSASYSSGFGYSSLLSIKGSYNSGLGYNSGGGGGSGTYCVYLGASTATTGNLNESIALGSGATITSSNQCVIGSPTYPIFNTYFSGVTHTAPWGINIRGSGGSGSNINGADLSFYAGLPTGDGSSIADGRHGYISLWTGDVGASGTTLRTATEKARLVQGGDLVLGITSDTKGLVLKASDGHYWRITMSTLGVLTTADLGTSIPT